MSIQDPREIEKVKIVMLKGEKGEQGDVSEAQMESAISEAVGAEATLRQQADATLNTEINYLSTYVTPEMYGAFGDGVTNDYNAIQNAINSGSNVIFSNKTYYIGSNTLSITESNHSVICGAGSKIVYDGTDYAIRFNNINGKDVILGTIEALSGSCIEIISENYTSENKDRVQYLNLSFDILKALNNCIHGYSVGSTCWINEIRISKGRLEAGNIGIFLEKVNADAQINGWRIDNVGIEGVSIGVSMKAIAGSIANISMNNMRILEIPPQYALKTEGECFNIIFSAPDHVSKTYFSISNASYGIQINAPLYKNLAGGGIPLSYHTIVTRNGNWVYDIAETQTVTYNYGTPNTDFTSIRRLGTMLSVKIFIQGVTMNANDVLCVLPYGPAYNFRLADAKGVLWQIETNGNVKVLSNITSTDVIIDTNFIYYVPFY